MALTKNNYLVTFKQFIFINFYFENILNSTIIDTNNNFVVLNMDKSYGAKCSFGSVKLKIIFKKIV